MQNSSNWAPLGPFRRGVHLWEGQNTVLVCSTNERCPTCKWRINCIIINQAESLPSVATQGRIVHKEKWQRINFFSTTNKYKLTQILFFLDGLKTF